MYDSVNNAIIQITPSGVEVKVDHRVITANYLEKIIREKTAIDWADMYPDDGDWSTDGYKCYYDEFLVAFHDEISTLIDAMNIIKFGKIYNRFE